MDREQYCEHDHNRDRHRKYDFTLFSEQFRSGRNIRNGNEQVAIGDTQKVAAATYGPVEQLHREDAANTGHERGQESEPDDLLPIWLDGLLRQDRLFKDLQTLGELVSLEILA